MPLGQDHSTRGNREQEYFLGVPTEDHEEADSRASLSPSLATREEERSSTRIAIINFFKGLFGAGVLAIPNAFSYTGKLGRLC